MWVDDVQQVLAAWNERIITDDEVARWYAEAIDQLPATELPEWLLDLAIYGAAACMGGDRGAFIAVRQLTFREQLSIRVRALDVLAAENLDAFVRWLSRACMGEDLERPEVQLGYQVDHLWSDCDRMDLACSYVRSHLLGATRDLPEPSPSILRILRSRSAGSRR